MRLAVCALSAVLLSGCSWLGMGGHSGSSYHGSGVYGANCAPVGGGYNTAGYGTAGFGNGCGGAGGYGVGGAQGYGAGFGGAAGYGAGAQGYGAGYGGAAGYGAGGQAGYGAGAQGYGAGYGAGFGGAQGLAAQGYGATAGQQVGFNGAYNANALYGGGLAGLGSAGMGGYGAVGVTTLGANAPYGAAAGTVLGTQQYAGGQYGAGGTVTTVAGNPVYVQQPYPAYYGVPQYRAVAGGGFGGGAMPFGLEAGIGTDFAIDGDILAGEEAKDNVSAISAISYKDAFENGTGYDLASTYDLDRNTTLIGRIGYNKASGKSNKVGTVTEGGLTEDLYAEFTDLEQVTLEGGLRRYVGGWTNPVGGFRPYVGATGGFVHTDDIDITQSSATLVDPALFTQNYVDGGWSPTASGVIGAEWQAGPRTAIGLETGLRWTDKLDTNLKSSDRISVPVRLRGRVSF